MSPHGEEVQADDAVPLLTDGLSTTFSRIPTKKISNESSVGASFVNGRHKNYVVAIFCLTAALLYADQNLMAPNLTQIAEDFGFDENERDKYLGGYIAAAFYVVGAPAALLFGYLSDTVNRRNLLFWAVILGEGPCILTLFVKEYWQLFFLRLLTGISLGGAPPLVFSLLGDLYESRYRSSVSAAVQVATGIGLAAGQGISGITGPVLGWRAPFVFVSVPTVLLAIVMVLTTEEPQRGLSEASLIDHLKNNASFQYREKVTWKKAFKLLRIPTNIFIILQGLPGCLPWGILLTFMNDFLAQNKGLSVATATSIVLFIGIGGAIGVIGGGLIGQCLYNSNKWKMPVFIGLCTLFGTLPLLFLVNAEVSTALLLSYISALFTGIFSSTVGPNMRAMIMNVNEPETRGIALALQTMLDDLGKGLGPGLVAIIITKVGRTKAFNIATCGWIPCGILLLCTSFTIRKDEDDMQHRMQKSISRTLQSEEAAGMFFDRHTIEHERCAEMTTRQS